jgi:protein-disulfide isomerase
MKLLILGVFTLAACRPSDGGSQNAPATGRRDTPRAVAVDSARTDGILQRADAARIQGSPNAPVWIVEVSDFQCPYCKQWHDQVYPLIVRDFVKPGIVRMAYLNLALPQHQHAVPAAEAALCAGLQDRFWPMHDKLFDTQNRWVPLADARPYFDSLALSTGLKAPEFRDCLRSQLMRRIVSGDRTRASSSGVQSTPTFFVGDQPIVGVGSIEAFRAAIQRARAKSGGRPPQ